MKEDATFDNSGCCRWLRLKYYHYSLWSGIYMLEKWERALFSTCAAYCRTRACCRVCCRSALVVCVRVCVRVSQRARGGPATAGGVGMSITAREALTLRRPCVTVPWNAADTLVVAVTAASARFSWGTIEAIGTFVQAQVAGNHDSVQVAGNHDSVQVAGNHDSVAE